MVWGDRWVLATTYRFRSLARLRRAFGRLPAHETALSPAAGARNHSVARVKSQAAHK